jgi:hypothetical protein
MTNPAAERPARRRAPGGGRKPIGDRPRVQVRLSLDVAALARLKELGHGNASQAVHDLLEWLDAGRLPPDATKSPPDAGR